MRVPVVDSQGAPLHPCKPARARRLIDGGQAAPRRDERGKFYIQLTCEPAAKKARTRRQRRKIARELQAALLNALVGRRGYVVSGKLDRLNVIDVEATCWEHAPPDGQESEIIEIGLCVLDLHSGERIARHSILVRPEHSQVSPFCTDLTTLTPAQVAEGISFAEACALLKSEYQTHERVWASYGDYDRRLFEKQCAACGVDYPFGPTHVNVKNLLALIKGLRREVGLIRALELLDLSAEGTHHRGVDDAWNAALVLARLIMLARSGSNN